MGNGRPAPHTRFPNANTRPPREIPKGNKSKPKPYSDKEFSKRLNQKEF